jgi:hypothetical protein
MEEQAAAERRNFLFQQAIAAGQVWIQMRLAMAQALVLSPVTLGEPLVSYARAQGLMSLGIILAQSVPAFAEGTEYVHGPGTETSDDVLTWLSRGERVFKAKDNREMAGMSNEEVVKAAQWYRSMTGDLRGDLYQQGGNTTLDMDALAEKIAGPITREIRRKPTASVYLDKNAPYIAVQRGQHKAKYYQDQFGVKI